MSERSEVKILMVDDLPANLLALGGGPRATRASSWSPRNSAAKRCGDCSRRISPSSCSTCRCRGLDGFETAALIRQRQTVRAHADHLPHRARRHRRAALSRIRRRRRRLPDQADRCRDILRSKVDVFVDLFRKTERVRSQEVEIRENADRASINANWPRRRNVSSPRGCARKSGWRGKFSSGFSRRSRCRCPGSTSAARRTPPRRPGGDYFDYIPMLDGALAIVIGDVSGHGFGPALLMSETRAYVRAFHDDPHRRRRNRLPRQPGARPRRTRRPLHDADHGAARSRHERTGLHERRPLDLLRLEQRRRSEHDADEHRSAARNHAERRVRHLGARHAPTRRHRCCC